MSNKTKKPNKTAFIKAHPEMSAAELVAFAAKQKIKLIDKYIYNCRAKVRANGGAPARKAGRPRTVRVNGLPGGAPKLIELEIRADGEEIISVRIPAATAGRALYDAIVSSMLKC